MHVAVLRVRFDTTTDPTTVWSDSFIDTWMQPLHEFSLAHYWWVSSHGFFTLEHTVWPAVVMADPRGNPGVTNARAALVSAAVTAGTDQAKVDWDETDILLLHFAQATDLFGGGTVTVPLRDGTTKDIPVTVCDVKSTFVDCCQELGHSLGFSHEVSIDGTEYASPYSCMSSRTSTITFLRGPDPALPDGDVFLADRDFVAYGHPAQRDVGAMLTGAQMLSVPGFATSGFVRQLSTIDVRTSVKVRLYRPNYAVLLPQPPPVVLAFPSPLLDGRTYAVEFRQGGGYDAGITEPVLAVHSFAPGGRVRYDGAARMDLLTAQTDWAYVPGGFSLRWLAVDPAGDWADLELRPGAALSFPIRGALLLGGFRRQDELDSMSHDDMRNTLIVELTNRTKEADYQAFDNDRLAGAGALLVAMRRLGIRDDATLRTMTADDLRNTLIVELDAQTHVGRQLQGYTDLELVQILLGSDLPWRGVNLNAVAHWTRGVLLVGGFRTQHELNAMSDDDMRNTLIVELTKHSNQTDYQAYADRDLAGAGAVMVAMRELKIRDDATLRTMSSDDQRNTLIVVLDAQTHTGRDLQALDDLQLVLVALGQQRAV